MYIIINKSRTQYNCLARTACVKHYLYVDPVFLPRVQIWHIQTTNKIMRQIIIITAPSIKFGEINLLNNWGISGI